jgi:hypothetical protein
MAHPLELSYNWRLPLTFSTLGLSISLGVLIPDRAAGSAVTVTLLVLLWAGFMSLLWLRTRAYLMVDGPRLRVRRAVTTHELSGAQVSAVRQRRTPHGPAYRLVLDSAGAPQRSVTVPTGLLRRGEPTLFGWILAEAPEADLDDGSQRALGRLRSQGHLEHGLRDSS